VECATLQKRGSSELKSTKLFVSFSWRLTASLSVPHPHTVFVVTSSYVTALREKAADARANRSFSFDP
jgi:hypothetical protein